MTARSKKGATSIGEKPRPASETEEEGKATTIESEEERSPAPASVWRLAAGVAIVVVAVAVAGPFFAPAQIVAQVQPAAMDPSQPAPMIATYVGRETCGKCHEAEVKAWAGSHHAEAMQHATASTVHGDFNDAHFTYGDVTTTFYRQDGKFMIRTDGPDGTLHDFEAKFTFGVAPLEQYLLQLPGGRLQAFSIAWDSRPKADGGQRWLHLHPEETIKTGDPLHWTGLQQNWNYMCADCHSTNLRRNYDPVAGDYHTSFSEINVSCESCHGPGSLHLAWARKDAGWLSLEPSKGLSVALDERRGVTWTLDPNSGNSTRSAPRQTTREIETCAHCHARRGPIWGEAKPGAPIGDAYRVALLDDNLYFPDGQIRDEVYEYGSFLQSRMFHAGVTCSDCHDPHSLQLRASANGVCLQCHAAEKYDVASPPSSCAQFARIAMRFLSYADPNLYGRRPSPRSQHPHTKARSQPIARRAERLQ